MKRDIAKKILAGDWIPASVRESVLWKKHKHLTIGGTITVVFLIFLTFYMNRKVVEAGAVIKGSAVSAVYGTVSVDPINQVIVRTRNNGLISQIKVKPGDAVKKDQPLIEITDESLKRLVEASTKEMEQATTKHKIGPASNSLLKTKEAELVRIKRLFEAGSIAQIEFERVTNECQTLKNSVQTEQISLDAEFNAAQQKLKELQETVDQLIVTAPIDGLVLDLYCHLGEFVPPQTQLVRIGSAANQIVAMVNEEDVGKLKKGMKGLVRLYAHGEKDLDATLVDVLPQADGQSYKVLFSLDTPPTTLLPGMTGEMNVIIGRHEDALIVPTRAIRKNTSGDYVYAVIGGTVEMKPVKVGYRSLEKAEILSGVEKDMLVILSEHDQVTPGQSVRTKEAASSKEG